MNYIPKVPCHILITSHIQLKFERERLGGGGGDDGEDRRPPKRPLPEDAPDIVIEISDEEEEEQAEEVHQEKTREMRRKQRAAARAVHLKSVSFFFCIQMSLHALTSLQLQKEMDERSKERKEKKAIEAAAAVPNRSKRAANRELSREKVSFLLHTHVPTYTNTPLAHNCRAGRGEGAKDS